VEISPVDPVAYLAARRFPSARLWGALLLGATLLTAFNFRYAILAPAAFPGLFDNLLVPLLWGIFSTVASLLAVVCVVSVPLLVPLLAASMSARILQAWIRQRRVHDMLCAGLSASLLVDRLAALALRWWLAVSLPSLPALALLYPRGLESLSTVSVALGLWLLLGGAAIYLGLYASAWSAVPGRARAPLLGSLLLVQGLPWALLVQLGASLSMVGAWGVYTLLAARAAAIYALTEPEALPRPAASPARAGRISPLRPLWLPDNAIAARQALGGARAGELMIRLALAVSFVLTALVADRLQAVWPYAFLLGTAVLWTSFRAASKMSQIVRHERESRNLEALLSTPMSGRSFLAGWLVTCLRAAWSELGMVLMAVLAAVSLAGRWQPASTPLLPIGLCLALLFPLLAAYLGAALAGQARSRAEVSGQLLASFGLLGMLAVPQWLASAHLVSLPLSLAALLVSCGALCAVLDRYAGRQLDRVFSPRM
jgi:hypothetical protein